jgi:hypothetical protein
MEQPRLSRTMLADRRLPRDSRRGVSYVTPLRACHVTHDACFAWRDKCHATSRSLRMVYLATRAAGNGDWWAWPQNVLETIASKSKCCRPIHTVGLVHPILAAPGYCRFRHPARCRSLTATRMGEHGKAVVVPPRRLCSLIARRATSFSTILAAIRRATKKGHQHGGTGGLVCPSLHRVPLRTRQPI